MGDSTVTSRIKLLIDKYKSQWDKHGMGSGVSYSSVVSDLEAIIEDKPSGIDVDNMIIEDLTYSLKCGCGGNMERTEDGLVCDVCG